MTETKHAHMTSITRFFAYTAVPHDNINHCLMIRNIQKNNAIIYNVHWFITQMNNVKHWINGKNDFRKGLAKPAYLPVLLLARAHPDGTNGLCSLFARRVRTQGYTGLASKILNE